MVTLQVGRKRCNEYFRLKEKRYAKVAAIMSTGMRLTPYNKTIFIVQALVLIFVCAGCNNASLNPLTPKEFLDNDNPKNWHEVYPVIIPVPSQPPVEFKFLDDNSQNISSMEVYVKERPLITTNYIREVAKRLGVKGELICNDSGARVLETHDKMAASHNTEEWEAAKPDADLYRLAQVYYRESDEDTTGYTTEKLLDFPMFAGLFTYQVHSSQTAEYTNQETFPDDETARKIAYAFLNKAGLLSNGFGSFEDAKNKFTVIPHEVYGDVEHLSVEYYVQIDGISLISPHSLYDIWINSEGEVIRLSAEWPEYDYVGSFDIISEQEAFEALIEPRTGNDMYLQNIRRGYNLPGGCTQINIEKVSLAYISYHWLLPVYKFEGKCLDASGKNIGGFNGWVEAIA
jgi:hypothetical protein